MFWPCSPLYLAHSSVDSRTAPSKRILVLILAHPAPQFEGEKTSKCSSCYKLGHRPSVWLKLLVCRSATSPPKGRRSSYSAEDFSMLTPSTRLSNITYPAACSRFDSGRFLPPQSTSEPLRRRLMEVNQSLKKEKIQSSTCPKIPRLCALNVMGQATVERLKYASRLEVQQI